MERAAGIEPASSAWKAEVLPLHNARITTLQVALINSKADFYSTLLQRLTCLYGGGRWIRTTEAFASDLQSDPFGRSGIPPKNGRLFSGYSVGNCQHNANNNNVYPKNWSWREESNPRPADYKSAALPTELRQHLNNGARF